MIDNQNQRGYNDSGNDTANIAPSSSQSLVVLASPVGTIITNATLSRWELELQVYNYVWLGLRDHMCRNHFQTKLFNCW
uniref:Protein-ribulosamine 3-kinaseic isoform X2 n=1 Tax=Rhizophora mucronata TaxID=61149 RepID=A0A2P2LB93_RHIMU